jgi:mRNA-degrading endonuclease RelE of RelBE toxin-antitoxin system
VMRVNFTKRASDAARNLQPKPARQIAAKIAKLRVNAYPQDSKKLHGSDLLRVDSGEYRIVYSVAKLPDPRTGQEETILNIEAIGKRNDDELYRQIKRA